MKIPVSSSSLSVFMSPVATLVANSEALKAASPSTLMPLTRFLMSREMCLTTLASSARSDAFPADFLVGEGGGAIQS